MLNNKNGGQSFDTCSPFLFLLSMVLKGCVILLLPDT